MHHSRPDLSWVLPLFGMGPFVSEFVAGAHRVSDSLGVTLEIILACRLGVRL
jgi:hypothetical protein